MMSDKPLTSAIAVLALAGLIGVLAVSFRFDPHDLRSAAVGQPAPAFDLELLEGGGRLTLEQLRGKIVLVNFWASWCIPCKQENPALASVWERYRTADVVLVGIVYQDSIDAAREYTTRLGNTWPSVLDDNGRTAFAFGVFGIPETFFIGRDGVIACRHIGPIDQETLIRGIDTLRTRP